MIISHKYKFIFIKTSKTAGTSIEIGLSKHCGTSDIITPLPPEDEKTRMQLGYPGARNYSPSIWEHSIQGLARLAGSRRSKRRFYNHIGAAKIKSRIGNKIWDSYYKFCFERNPWDRVISHYYWKQRLEPDLTISDYIESGKPLLLKHYGYNLYTLCGKVAVDKVCRFECISEELEAIRKQLGIPEMIVLPRTKSEYRKDKRSYREILGNEERDYISALFREEINLLGYEF